MGEQDKTTNSTESAALPPSAAEAAPAPAGKGDGPVEGSDALPKAG